MDKNHIYAALQAKARDELGQSVVGQFNLFKSTLTSVYQGLLMVKDGSVGVNQVRLNITAANATFQTLARNALTNRALQVSVQHNLDPTEFEELVNMSGDNLAKLADQHASRIEKVCFLKLSGHKSLDGTNSIYIDKLGRARNAQEAVYLFTKLFAVSVDARASILSLKNAGNTTARLVHPIENHPLNDELVSLDETSWVNKILHPNSQISVVRND